MYVQIVQFGADVMVLGMDKRLSDDVHDPVFIRAEAGAKLGCVQLASLAILLIINLLVTLTKSSRLAVLYKLRKGLLRGVIVPHGQLDLEAMISLSRVIADDGMLLLYSGVIGRIDVNAAADGEDDFVGLVRKGRIGAVEKTLGVGAIACKPQSLPCI